jgi:mannose-6-phosphate isomerase-like protein (cupin superfamily)
MTELIVAMAILVIAVLPIGYSFLNDARVFRAAYQRAVVMEIVDGEIEVLAAGEWRAFPEGTHHYTIQYGASRNLPPGQFQFTRAGKHLRLEWMPTRKSGVGTVVRETTLK